MEVLYHPAAAVTGEKEQVRVAPHFLLNQQAKFLQPCASTIGDQ